jgi:hypothetical protein
MECSLARTVADPRTSLDETYLAKDLAPAQDREGDRRAVAWLQDRLHRPRADHIDRVADLALAQDDLVLAQTPLGEAESSSSASSFLASRTLENIGCFRRKSFQGNVFMACACSPRVQRRWKTPMGSRRHVRTGRPSVRGLAAAAPVIVSARTSVGTPSRASAAGPRAIRAAVRKLETMLARM